MSDVPTPEELVQLAIGQKPIEFQQTFTDMLVARAAERIADRKMELAHDLFNPQEEPEIEEPEEEEVDDTNT